MTLLNPYLALEDTLNLWDVKVSGINLWPEVRSVVLEAILRRYMDYQSPHHQVSNLRYLIRPNRWQKLLRTLAFMLDSKSPHSVLFFTQANPTSTRIYKHFYEKMRGSLVFESSWKGVSSPTKQGVDYSLFLSDTLFLWTTVQSQFVKLPTSSLRDIEGFAAFLSQQFELPQLQPQLTMIMKKRVQGMPIIQSKISRYLIPRLKNKFVFIHLASYMGRYSSIIKLFHDMGFVVAEAQHGTVYDAHFAYNFSPSLIQNPQHLGRLHLPDIFLAFGNYWISQIRVPFQSIIIGNPHLSQAVKGLEATTKTDNEQILIISQGYLTTKMVEIAQHLSHAFPKRKIIFKLHPGEIGFRERYVCLFDLPNVQVKSLEDVYELIAQSGIIIGGTSTVLYEALAYSSKRIFILDNQFVPDSVGTKFSTPEALIDLIIDDNQGLPSLPANEFWAEDWQQNTANFLHAHIQ